MRKFFAKGKAYHYFIFIFILLLAVLAFYLSCRSKSPTESDSRLNNQVAAQSTNNTTTSSSTTTSVKQGQSPTNTTTLITSRTLITTSTRTTTTSTSIPPDTTTRATTSIGTTTTTASAQCDLRWQTNAQGIPFILMNGTRVLLYSHLITSETNFTVIFRVYNYGSMHWNNCTVIYELFDVTTETIEIWKTENLGPFPPGGRNSFKKGKFQFQAILGHVYTLYIYFSANDTCRAAPHRFSFTLEIW